MSQNRTDLSPAAAQADRPALSHRQAFVRFWIARTPSTLSFQVTAVVVVWQVYALTGRTFQLGLVGLARFVPRVILTAPAVVLGGLGTIVVALLWSRLFPALRRADGIGAAPS